MSCSRQSSAIDFGPRNDASTISVFCWAVNFRYLRVSLIDPLDRLSGRFSEGLRTEPRRLRRLAPTQNHLIELSTASRGPGHVGERAADRAHCCVDVELLERLADLLVRPAYQLGDTGSAVASDLLDLAVAMSSGAQEGD